MDLGMWLLTNTELSELKDMTDLTGEEIVNNKYENSKENLSGKLKDK